MHAPAKDGGARFRAGHHVLPLILSQPPGELWCLGAVHKDLLDETARSLENKWGGPLITVVVPPGRLLQFSS
jgi:hypothetical protein